MKILHLTDLHFDQKKHSLLDEVKEKTIELLSKEKINYFIFSGDLVTKPTKADDFIVAKTYLIDPILKALNLTDESFFICEGNHDVQRNQELSIVAEKFSGFKGNAEVEDFIKKQDGQQLEASLKNHQSYFDFLKTGVKFEKNDIIHPLYTIHKRTYDNKVINIVTLNSAWRCISQEVDSGNLFYPISFLKEVIAKTDKNAFKVLVMHHPLREFKPFVARDMEDIIYDGFNVLLTGHVHKKGHSVHFSNDVGIFCNSSQAVFNKNLEGIELGFSILELDDNSIDFSEFILKNHFYNEKDKRFYEKTPIPGSIPLGPLKDSQNKLRKTFRKRFEEAKIKADELLIFSNEEETSFLNFFGDPVIRDKPKTQVKRSGENFKIETFYSNDKNYLIFAKDKYGKTSLLYKIYLDLLDTFIENKTIPFLIDFKSYKFANDNFDIIKNFTVHCDASRAKVQDILKNYKIKLLIDNYNSDNTHFTQQILKLIEMCPNISIIGTVEETLISAYQDHKLNHHSFSNLFIYEIGRKQIRSLTSKVPTIAEEKIEDVLDRLQKVFNQLNFPYNYWNVSLFLWIYNKTKDNNFHNNFEFIQLYIDGLLQREKHVTDKSIKIDYEDLKEFLGHLAHKLVTGYYKHSHSVEYVKLVEITNDYRKLNYKIVIETHDLIELLLERKIIKKLDNDRYTFRLNGVFEFFIAFYMKDNKEFALEAISEDTFYFSFYNEFELYTGFNRKDKEFVNSIFDKTQRIFNSVNKKFAEEGNIDTNLTKRIFDIDQVTKGLKVVSEKNKFVLNLDEQDELMSEVKPINENNGDVKQKMLVTKIEDTSEHLEKALFILCRVFRNSNINDPEDPDLNKKILNYILDSVCTLGFVLIDETKEKALEDNEITLHEKSLVKLIMEIMPIVIQTFLFDALAQNNLERLLEEKLVELKTDPTKNQFKLFLVYYLLIDLDFKNKRHLIGELMGEIKLGVLRHSNLVKLYLYLAFKASGKADLDSELQGYIRAQEKLIDSNPRTEDESTMNVNKKIETVKAIGRVRRKN